MKTALLAAAFAAYLLSILAIGAEDTLYDRMGGAPVIAKIVDQLLDLSMTDPRTKRSFAKINLKRLRAKLNEQICMLAKGPCEYSGDGMKEVHAGLDITDAEFDGLVEHTITAVDASGVGLREKNELLKMLAPMKRDVVTK